MSSTFARLGREVDVAKDELQEEIDRLKQEIGRLDEIANSAKTLKLVFILSHKINQKEQMNNISSTFCQKMRYISRRYCLTQSAGGDLRINFALLLQKQSGLPGH